ncbi:MAG TPA: histidine kinase [Novosphingobium sp.]|nr:histidine kinase [Novosphingobium sp.]
MQSPQPALVPAVETVAELRELYRAAEARAARLRLLSTNGRQLTMAESATIEAILQGCADRLGYFLGRRGGSVQPAAAAGLPIPAPGSDGRTLAVLAIEGLASLDDVADAEDREAVQLQLEMIGATIDRIERARDLQEREARLEFVVGRLFSAQEEERRRVSHELHDGVAQTATALARLLEGAESSAERTKLAGIARELVGELRAVIRGLRPTVLDDLGLEAGLRALAEALEAEGFAVRIVLASDVDRWPGHIETALYRVAQEALSNVRKHAGGPCRVTLELAARRSDERPYLRIADEGQGPQRPAGEDPARSHFGIDVMRERMVSIGGALDWQASPQGGVTVLASFPKVV